jgi:aryl-alcohol dehydrogenase-like predicted oxidoreductase
MLPIPGISSLEQLEENMKAAGIILTEQEWAAIDDITE